VQSICVFRISKKNCKRLSAAAGWSFHSAGMTDVKPAFRFCRNFWPSGPADHLTNSQAASLFLLADGIPIWTAQPVVMISSPRAPGKHFGPPDARLDGRAKNLFAAVGELDGIGQELVGGVAPFRVLDALRVEERGVVEVDRRTDRGGQPDNLVAEIAAAVKMRL